MCSEGGGLWRGWSMRQTGFKIDMVSCDGEGRHDLVAAWEYVRKGAPYERT